MTIVEGSTADTSIIQSAAKEADAVLHLAYNHDWTIDRQIAADEDEAVIKAFADVLEGTHKPFIIASGTILKFDLSTAGKAVASAVTEDKVADDEKGRHVATRMVLDLKSKGIRSGVIRYAPTVHGAGGDHGFIDMIGKASKKAGFVPYIDAGENRWNAVHVVDAAELAVKALESIEPGTVIHACAEDGIAFKEIAQAIAKNLGIETKSVTLQGIQEVMPGLGFIAFVTAIDVPANSDKTQKTFGWKPKEVGLVEDIVNNYEF